MLLKLICEYVGQYYILDDRVVVLVAISITTDGANIHIACIFLSYRLDMN